MGNKIRTEVDEKRTRNIITIRYMIKWLQINTVLKILVWNILLTNSTDRLRNWNFRLMSSGGDCFDCMWSQTEALYWNFKQKLVWNCPIRFSKHIFLTGIGANNKFFWFQSYHCHLSASNHFSKTYHQKYFPD